jgi:hypothetical protein
MRIQFDYISIIVIFMMISCTTEDEQERIQVIISNNSTSSVTITLQDVNPNDNTVIGAEELIIPPNQDYACNYFSDTGFRGLKECFSNVQTTRSQIIFQQNLKGYRCESNFSDPGSFCDNASKYQFAIPRNEVYARDNNTYTLTITQEDFENAFELPE